MMTMTTRKPTLLPLLVFEELDDATSACRSTAVIGSSFCRSSGAQERHHTTWGSRRRQRGTGRLAVSGIGFPSRAAAAVVRDPSRLGTDTEDGVGARGRHVGVGHRGRR